MFVLLTCASAFAQETNGTITGRVVDQQGSAVPGATVTAKSATTGFTRTEVSDSEGVYRLSALPVGIYDVTAELQGFTTVSKKGVEVNVGQTQAIDFPLKVAQLAETVNVTGATPLIQTTASSVGAVVDVKRIESLPLNGRQFANLAATVPGVGLSFHSDPTKSTQYAPLVNGGAGRNINYQIDGGDNNDDTVGGQLQAFPLEAIEQFNFQTQRFKAEYGRSNGGVLSVVTKSGTNLWTGSAFEFFRDKSMNALTETEKLPQINGTGAGGQGRLPPEPVRRQLRRPDREGPGALLLRDRAHEPGQDAGGQHPGAVPEQGRRLRRAVPRDPVHRQGDGEPEPEPVPVGALRPRHQLAAVQRRAQQHVRQLGRQHQQVQLDQPEPQLGAGRIEAERVHLPVRRLRQHHRVAQRRRRTRASRTA